VNGSLKSVIGRMKNCEWWKTHHENRPWGYFDATHRSHYHQMVDALMLVNSVSASPALSNAFCTPDLRSCITHHALLMITNHSL
jgi:hypothetical protein